MNKYFMVVFFFFFFFNIISVQVNQSALLNVLNLTTKLSLEWLYCLKLPQALMNPVDSTVDTNLSVCLSCISLASKLRSNG